MQNTARDSIPVHRATHPQSSSTIEISFRCVCLLVVVKYFVTYMKLFEAVLIALEGRLKCYQNSFGTGTPHITLATMTLC